MKFRSSVIHDTSVYISYILNHVALENAICPFFILDFYIFFRLFVAYFCLVEEDTTSFSAFHVP